MSAVLEQPGYAVRAMARADLVDVDHIEQRSYPYPWSRRIFHDCLQAGYCCRVIVADSVVLGYAVMSVAAGEAHILNLCIAPEHRRAGLGEQLLSCLIAEARRGGAEELFLEVRPSNRAARKLYAGAGFCRAGVRKDYYPDGEGREDALILARHLSDADLG